MDVHSVVVECGKNSVLVDCQKAGSLSDKYVVTNTSLYSGFIDFILSLVLRRTHLPKLQISPSLKFDVDRLAIQTKFSLLMLRSMHAAAEVLERYGKCLEALLNILAANGGLRETFSKITCKGGLIKPKEDWDMYVSILGHVDPRFDLYLNRFKSVVDYRDCFPYAGPCSKLTAEVCVMASKLAYENQNVIQKVVTHLWKMHFVEAYNCWNEFQQKHSTQVFIFTDKEQDAEAIVVAFRGTETFNAYDWCTDFDLSWYELPKVGRVHVGFLEALGLGDRNDIDTFAHMKRNIYRRLRSRLKSSLDHLKLPSSGLPDAVVEDCAKPLAYDVISDKLKQLIKSNKDAKVYITGHSLGAALATLFTTLLFYNKEEQVTSKVAAVYAFGQPRVGDKNFACFMEKSLNQPSTRYFRIVYSNDIVTRVPFDDCIFCFKHFGTCFYFNCFYGLQILSSEPNPNYSFLYWIFNFGIAIWEVIWSVLMRFVYGGHFAESMFGTLSRIVGIFMPGFAAHSIINYVNCVRLGPQHFHA